MKFADFTIKKFLIIIVGLLEVHKLDIYNENLRLKLLFLKIMENNQLSQVLVAQSSEAADIYLMDLIEIDLKSLDSKPVDPKGPSVPNPPSKGKKKKKKGEEKSKRNKQQRKSAEAAAVTTSDATDEI